MASLHDYKQVRTFREDAEILFELLLEPLEVETGC